MTLKELYAEKEKINKQIRELESDNAKKEKEKKIERNKQYIGKCFKLKCLPPYEGILAFKVMCLSNYSSDHVVNCLCVIDGCILRKDLGLWSSSIPRMIEKDSDPKIIELYNEIDDEEFNKILNNSIEEIKDENTYRSSCVCL